jgi:hypothetical protein
MPKENFQFINPPRGDPKRQKHATALRLDFLSSRFPLLDDNMSLKLKHVVHGFPPSLLSLCTRFVALMLSEEAERYYSEA